MNGYPLLVNHEINPVLESAFPRSNIMSKSNESIFELKSD